MRILVVNFASRDSLGGLALLEGSIKILRRAWPTASIRILSSEREDIILGIRVEKSVIAPRTGVSGNVKIIMLFAVLAFGILCMRCGHFMNAYARRFPRETSFLSEYLESDIVVGTGGDVLTEDYGLYSLVLCLSHLMIGKALGRKVVLFGETIGPFHGFLRRLFFRRFLNAVSLVLVRESLTRDYLTYSLKIREDVVFQMPDPSFAIDVPNNAQINKADIQTFPVCLIPSALTWRYFRGAEENPGQTYSDYLSFLGDIVRFFAMDIGAKVVIAPHVRGSFPLNDDLSVCHDILDRVKDCPGVELNDGLNSSEAFRDFFTRCQFLVTCRMHAGLAGYATSLPTVFVSYSTKFHGMATDISGSSKWLINARGEVINKEWISRTLCRIFECWEMRCEERQVISDNVSRYEIDFASAIHRLKLLSRAEQT